jgi:hypothetical protein
MAANMRMIQSKYMCDENKSERECREEFINNHPYFEYVYVPGDGNCLFHTLAEFYRRSGKTILYNNLISLCRGNLELHWTF